MPITLPYALCKLSLGKEEMTLKRQNNSFLQNKYTSQAIIQNVTNFKSELWKTVRLTSCKKTPDVSLLLSILPFFCICSFINTFKCFERLSLSWLRTRDLRLLRRWRGLQKIHRRELARIVTVNNERAVRILKPSSKQQPKKGLREFLQGQDLLINLPTGCPVSSNRCRCTAAYSVI